MEHMERHGDVRSVEVGEDGQREMCRCRRSDHLCPDTQWLTRLAGHGVGSTTSARNGEEVRDVVQMIDIQQAVIQL